MKSLRLGELCSTIRAVLNVIRSLVFAVLAFFGTRGQLAAEILALRHQLGVLRRSVLMITQTRGKSVKFTGEKRDRDR